MKGALGMDVRGRIRSVYEIRSRAIVRAGGSG